VAARDKFENSSVLITKIMLYIAVNIINVITLIIVTIHIFIVIKLKT